ncbi:hypothetical protein QCN27_08085 [Cereibacter sp. SYSU M97828]|nr:hypothetical protein [Cereibacter flavus]
MENSRRPIRGLLIAFVVAAILAAGMLYIYSDSTGAPDDRPLTGANLPDPATQPE